MASQFGPVFPVMGGARKTPPQGLCSLEALRPGPVPALHRRSCPSALSVSGTLTPTARAKQPVFQLRCPATPSLSVNALFLSTGSCVCCLLLCSFSFPLIQQKAALGAAVSHAERRRPELLSDRSAFLLGSRRGPAGPKATPASSAPLSLPLSLPGRGSCPLGAVLCL